MTTQPYKEHYNEWRHWPQVFFDIDLFDDVHDWVMNRFGVQYPGKEDVVLVSKNPDHFRIAIKDPKVLNVTLLKFHCQLCPSERERELTRREEEAKLDAEIKTLMAEIQKKLKDSPSYEQWIAGGPKENALFSHNNGVWTHVEE